MILIISQFYFRSVYVVSGFNVFFSEGINAAEYELFRDFSMAKRVRMLRFLRTLHKAMTGRDPSPYE